MQTKQILSRVMAVLLVSFTMMASGAGNAYSADLGSAKAAGLIGEQLNGYLGVVAAAPGDVQALVAKINQKRKALYQQIASKNATSLQAVEAMAGKKTTAKTPHGQFIRSASGQWVRK